MSAMNTLKKFGLEQAFNYVYKDPDKNFIKIMDWADKFSGGGFPTQRAMIREVISNPEHPYYPFIHRLVTDIDPHVMKTLVANFFINANLAGWKKHSCQSRISSPTVQRSMRFSRALQAGRLALAGLAAAYSALVQGFTLQGRPASFMMAEAKSYQLQMPLPVQW